MAEIVEPSSEWKEGGNPYWVISSVELLKMLFEVRKGTPPDEVFMTHYVNSEHSYINKDGDEDE